VDRQSSFISAQMFHYPTDPLICAINMALMCGFLHSLEDNEVQVLIPDLLHAAEPPRKRAIPLRRPSAALDFKHLFAGIWGPTSTLVYACPELNVIWYRDRQPGYLKLAWGATGDHVQGGMGEVAGKVKGVNMQPIPVVYPLPGDITSENCSVYLQRNMDMPAHGNNPILSISRWQV